MQNYHELSHPVHTRSIRALKQVPLAKTCQNLSQVTRCLIFFTAGKAVEISNTSVQCSFSWKLRLHRKVFSCEYLTEIQGNKDANFVGPTICCHASMRGQKSAQHLPTYPHPKAKSRKTPGSESPQVLQELQEGAFCTGWAEETIVPFWVQSAEDTPLVAMEWVVLQTKPFKDFIIHGFNRLNTSTVLEFLWQGAEIGCCKF